MSLKPRCQATSFPLLRVALLTTNLRAPKHRVVDGVARLLQKKDVAKLQSAKLAQEVIEAEKMLSECWAKAQSADLPHQKVRRLFGRCCIRCVSCLLQKQVYETIPTTLQQVAKMFEDDLQGKVAKQATALTASKARTRSRYGPLRHRPTRSPAQQDHRLSLRKLRRRPPKPNVAEQGSFAMLRLRERSPKSKPRPRGREDYLKWQMEEDNAHKRLGSRKRLPAGETPLGSPTGSQRSRRRKTKMRTRMTLGGRGTGGRVGGKNFSRDWGTWLQEWSRPSWHDEDWRHGNRRSGHRGKERKRGSSPPPPPKTKAKGKGKGKEKKIGGWQNKAVALVALIRAQKLPDLQRLAEKFMKIDDFAKNVYRHESIVQTHGVDRHMNLICEKPSGCQEKPPGCCLLACRSTLRQAKASALSGVCKS